MAVAIGLNVSSPPASSPRWGRITEIGCKFARFDQPDSSIYAKAASLGIRVLPILYDLGSIVSYANSLYSGGNPIAGWCGVIELGNECYLASGTPAYSSGSSYASAVKNGVHSAKGSHPNLKFGIEADYTHIANWLPDFWSTMGSQISDIWCLMPHVYTVPRGNVTGGTSIATQLAHYESFLAGKNTGQFILPTEQGVASSGSSSANDPNFVNSEADQATWYRTAMAELSNASKHPLLVGALMFELQDNPNYSGNHPQEAHFGLSRDSKSNWSTASSSGFRKEAWGVVQGYMASSGSADFTGNVAPGGGGGGGGGGSSFTQVTESLGADRQSINIANVDPTAVTLHIATMPADAPPGAGEAVYFDVPAATTNWINPDPTGHPWVDIEQLDATGAEIGTWYSSSTGGHRVQTFPTVADKPTTTTDAASSINSDGATLNADYNLGNQQSGTGTFDYGDTAAYGQTTPPISLTAAGTPTTPGFIAATGNAWVGNTGTVANPSTPGAGQNGHKIVALVGTKGNGVASDPVAPSTNWVRQLLMPSGGGTPVDHQDFANAAGTGIHRFSVYLLTCGSAEPANYTWGQQATDQGQAVVLMEWDGNADHLDALSAFLVNASAQAFSVPSGQPVHNHDVVIKAILFANGETLAPPSGFTEPTNADQHSATNTSGVSVEGSYKAITADGAVAAGTITSDNTNATGADTSCTLTLILKPKVSSASGTFSFPLTGRGPGKVTHYRSRVSSPGGDADPGSDQSFTTSTGSAPPTITNPAVSSVGPSNAIFTAHLAVNGADTDYHVHVTGPGGFSIDTPELTASTDRDLSIPLSGLPAGSSLEATLIASSATGDRNSAPVDFVTSGGQIVQGGQVKILAKSPVSMAGKIGTVLWPDADGTGWFVVIKGGFGHEFQSGQLEAV